MSRQRCKNVLPKPVMHFAQRQAGQAVIRTTLILIGIGVLLILVSAYLSRDEIRRYLFPLPTPHPRETALEKIKTSDQFVSRLFSSLSLSDDHISLKQFPRKDEVLEWNERFLVVNLVPEISLHQVEHARARTGAFFESDDLSADTAYESNSRLRITIKASGRITHQLFFHLAPLPLLPEAQKTPDAPYRIALVIDDLGENYGSFKELEALEVPITYAILPFQTHSVKIANEIHAKNRGEIILHLPLEPWNSENHSIPPGMLRTGMNREEFLAQLERNIKAVPHLSGVSNHMGSKLTEDRDKMGLMLAALKEKELYFLDSRTSTKTVGYPLAKKMLLKTARRDLFLDSTNDQSFVEKQLQKILPLAQRKGGTLIVIGHPHPDTISALKKHLPLLREQGVAVVPLSELVH